MFEAPSLPELCRVTIDQACVLDGAEPNMEYLMKTEEGKVRG